MNLVVLRGTRPQGDVTELWVVRCVRKGLPFHRHGKPLSSETVEAIRVLPIGSVHDEAVAVGLHFNFPARSGVHQGCHWLVGQPVTWQDDKDVVEAALWNVLLLHFL